jgi:hypothetical protein
MYAAITLEGAATRPGTITHSHSHRVYHAQVDEGGTTIPPRIFLDPAKIAQAQADAGYILHIVFGK